jgi:hypothetical protein
MASIGRIIVALLRMAALVNGWRLLYRTGFYNYAATQMHELGHNFNLGHSGGLDNLTYTDHTCLVSASVVCISCITACALPMYNLSHEINTFARVACSFRRWETRYRVTKLGKMWLGWYRETFSQCPLLLTLYPAVC